MGKKKLNRGKFQVRVGRAVNEVDAKGQVTQALFEFRDRLLDVDNIKSGSAKKGEHTSPGSCFHHVHRRDAIGHGAADVGISQSVCRTKFRVTQRTQL